MAKSKINIEMTDDIKSLDLSGCILSADAVSLSVVPDKSAVDDNNKPIHESYKINMKFPLDNVSMHRIMVQALNNNKTDVSNNLRRRINNEYIDTPNVSGLMQELIAQADDNNVIQLNLLGFPGVYPDVPLTPEQIAQMNIQALSAISDKDKRKIAYDKQIELLTKKRNAMK